MTSRASLARRVSGAIYSGRDNAPGPEAVGEFLKDRDLHRMFQTIGGTYDLQNRILSLGRDAWWRTLLAERVRAVDGALVIDMATGTGDVAIAIARRWPGARIIGIDYSSRMLAVARRKHAALPAAARERITLRRGDIRATDVPDAAADIVTNTFAMRNIPDRAGVLGEFHRVLKRGGRLFIMEPGLPSSPFVGLLYRTYFEHVMPFAGNVFSRTDYAYTYLRHSIEGFPKPDAFIAEIERAGFAHVSATPLTFGIAVLYRAVRAS